MPYLEQGNAYDHVRLDLEWHDPINLASGVPSLSIPVFNCPSDPNSDTLFDAGPGEGFVKPGNYGFNFGTWLIFDPRDGTRERVGPNRLTRLLRHAVIMQVWCTPFGWTVLCVVLQTVWT